MHGLAPTGLADTARRVRGSASNAARPRPTISSASSTAAMMSSSRRRSSFTARPLRRIRLASETIRDVDEQDRDVEWSTFVWVPVGERSRIRGQSGRIGTTTGPNASDAPAGPNQLTIDGSASRTQRPNASTLTKSMNATAGSASSAPSLSTRTSTTRTRSTRVSTTSCRSLRTASTAAPTHNSLTGFATSAKEPPP